MQKQSRVAAALAALVTMLAAMVQPAWSDVPELHMEYEAQWCAADGATFLGLAGRHARLVASATRDNGGTLALYVDDATGQWTALSLFPDGTACQVAAGDAFGLAPQGATR